MVNESQKVALRADVIATVLEDGAALLDLETKYFYSVNAPGWAILQLYETGTTRENVLGQCRALGAGPADEVNILAFLDYLEAEKLIAPAPYEAAPAAVSLAGEWTKPVIEKTAEPLQRLISSAFDPTMPLAE